MRLSHTKSLDNRRNGFAFIDYKRVDMLPANSNNTGPFSEVLGDSIVSCRQDILFWNRPLVFSLLAFCSPAAIVFTIATVVVWVAINAVAGGWAITHVCEESLKSTAASPFVTDKNASATIITELPMAAIVAPLNHRFPCFVFRSTAHAVLCDGFCEEASATLFFRPASQDVGSRHACVSAIAQAFNKSAVPFPAKHLCDNEPPITITHEINSPVSKRLGVQTPTRFCSSLESIVFDENFLAAIANASPQRMPIASSCSFDNKQFFKPLSSKGSGSNHEEISFVCIVLREQERCQ